MKRKSYVKYAEKDQELFQPVPAYPVRNRTGRYRTLVMMVMLTVMLVLVSFYALAGEISQLAETTMDDIRQGQLLFRSEQGAAYQLAPTLETRVDITISGMIARCRVEQRFHNSTSQWQEGVYVFPLPEDAAVDHMDMMIGERQVQGQIRERQQARRIYQQAKENGQKAALIEQQRPNMFTNAVANIAPGETIRVIIEYQQSLRYDQGQFSLRFPMAITPRYIPGQVVSHDENIALASGWAVNTDQVDDATAITPPVRQGSEKINPLTLSIELNSGFPLQDLKSSYHPVSIKQNSTERFSIQLAAGSVATERDFELVWKPRADQQPRAAVFSQQHQGGHYQMLMVMPPSHQAQTSAMGKEVIYVIDTSGSMGGTSIRQARKSLLLALSRLRSQDWFNVIQFNSSTEKLFPTAVQASHENIRAAKEYVESLSAQGGTEIASALKTALENAQQSGRVRQVIFLTDGSVGNERELFSIIRSRLGNSRLFTVGIGSAPNSFFMRKAALFGRGSFTYIGDISEVQEKMSALFNKLETPVMTDLQLELDSSAKVEQFPPRLPDLYAGEPLMLTLHSANRLEKIMITGKQDNHAWRVQLDVMKDSDDRGVAVHWARQKIAALMDAQHEGDDMESIRQQVIDVALSHHLVSRFTSLVAVDITPVRPADKSLHKSSMPVNLPHGQQYEKIFGALPGTATSYQLQSLIGMLLMVGALLFHKLSGRREFRDA